MKPLATKEERTELAEALERVAVRVRTSDVRDYTLEVEHGVRDVVVGPYVQHEHDGSMRVAITVQF